MSTPTNEPTGRPREWQPRIWEGCNVRSWYRLLGKNYFAVHPRFWYIAFIVSAVCIVHTILRLLQQAIYGDKPSQTPLESSPIFIVGHWRTGTTLLHELLLLDDEHTCPNTYQCLVPHHFILTEKRFTRWLWFLMPSKRPMDNMAAGWDKPQEDEFAMCMLGEPSPYLMIAFPNHAPMDQDAFDVRSLPEAKQQSWKQTLSTFLSEVTFVNPKRLVLKSPTHSCRLPTLLEMFPDAKFVHIVRNPYSVFRSTYNLWKTLGETHGLQQPDCEGLEEYVFSTFEMLYEKLEEGRQLVGSEHFYEVKYEDLVRDPMGEMEELYAALDLGDFERARPALQKYFDAQSDYRTNRYPQLTPELKAKIGQRWASVIERYGYEPPQPPNSELSDSQD